MTANLPRKPDWFPQDEFDKLFKVIKESWTEHTLDDCCNRASRWVYLMKDHGLCTDYGIEDAPLKMRYWIGLNNVVTTVELTYNRIGSFKVEGEETNI